MIIWITGNSQSGKTTLAKALKTKDTIILDGDEMRQSISAGTGFSRQDREEHNIRVAKLAKILENQGFNVIVAVICPYDDLRKKVQKITECKFIYLPGGKSDPEYPYEPPTNPDITLIEYQIATPQTL